MNFKQLKLLQFSINIFNRNLNLNPDDRLYLGNPIFELDGQLMTADVISGDKDIFNSPEQRRDFLYKFSEYIANNKLLLMEYSSDIQSFEQPNALIQIKIINMLLDEIYKFDSSNIKYANYLTKVVYLSTNTKLDFILIPDDQDFELVSLSSNQESTN